MGHADGTVLRVKEHQGHTVGKAEQQGHAQSIGDQGICPGYCRAIVQGPPAPVLPGHAQDFGAMHLLRAAGIFCLELQSMEETPAVLDDLFRFVTHMKPHI